MPTAREERLRHHWDEGAERYDERIAPLERRYLADVLARAGGNLSRWPSAPG